MSIYKQYMLEDTGERDNYADGAQRDGNDNKPRPDLISPHMIYRLSMLLMRGADKYEPHNWEKGIHVSRFLESLERHLLAWKMGEDDEDNLAAIIFNAMGIMHIQAEVAAGRLDPDYDDAQDVQYPDTQSHDYEDGFT